jgi:hypothetical protein
MTEQQWRSVAELIQATETGFEQPFMERLATAVRELDLPSSVLQRMQQAATVALRRAFLDDSTRAARVTVLTRAIQAVEGSIAHSWGFFLVERDTGDGAPYQVRLFVYPDGS